MVPSMWFKNNTIVSDLYLYGQVQTCFCFLLIHTWVCSVTNLCIFKRNRTLATCSLHQGFLHGALGNTLVAILRGDLQKCTSRVRIRGLPQLHGVQNPRVPWPCGAGPTGRKKENRNSSDSHTKRRAVEDRRDCSRGGPGARKWGDVTGTAGRPWLTRTQAEH